MTRSQALMISILEAEISALNDKIECGMATSIELGRHMLIKEQIRELKHLHSRLQYYIVDSNEHTE